jgi:hypothetical protein
MARSTKRRGDNGTISLNGVEFCKAGYDLTFTPDETHVSTMGVSATVMGQYEIGGTVSLLADLRLAPGAIYTLALASGDELDFWTDALAPLKGPGRTYPIAAVSAYRPKSSP